MIDCTRLSHAAVALALVLAPGLPAAAQTSPSKTRIDNFGQVSAVYFRGAQPRGRDYQDLAALGVKTVIDLQESGGDRDEPKLVKAAGMTYYKIPMSTRRPPTSEQLAFFFKLLNDAVGQPVYVHCKEGRHRTGVMTAAYRMSFERWTADQAFSEMKQYRFGADFLHPEFKTYVYRYDTSRVPVVTAAQQQ